MSLNKQKYCFLTITFWKANTFYIFTNNTNGTKFDINFHRRECSPSSQIKMPYSICWNCCFKFVIKTLFLMWSHLWNFFSGNIIWSIFLYKITQLTTDLGKSLNCSYQLQRHRLKTVSGWTTPPGGNQEQEEREYRSRKLEIY